MLCKFNAFVVPFPVLSSFCSRTDPWEITNLVLQVRVVLIFVLFFLTCKQMFGENHCSEISLDIILLVLLSLQPLAHH